MNRSAVIVEDEIPAAKRLERLLISRGFTVLCTLVSVSKLTEYLSKNAHPDWLFLDIELRDGTVFKAMENANISSRIVFTTAYSDRALKAFEHGAIDYLLKPIDETKLDATLEKAERLGNVLKPGTTSDIAASMLVAAGKTVRKIQMEEILYFSSEENSTLLHTADREFPIGKSLDKLDDWLDRKQFFRISRKYIVNRNFIESISSADVFICGQNLSVSRQRKKEFLDWFRNGTIEKQ